MATDQRGSDADIEKLVNQLAKLDGVSSTDLAKSLKWDLYEVKRVLLELEQFGVVQRTGRTKSTRWFLG